MKQVDLIIQGPYTEFTDEIISEYLKLSFIDKIIVSCWEKEVPSTNGIIVYNKDQIYEHEKVEFVRSVDNLDYSGVLNINYQLVTSLAGLKKSKNDLCVKLRSDQKFTHEAMNNMYKFFIDNIHKSKPEVTFIDSDQTAKGKIFIAGNFNAYLFHPRDWIFWGYRDDLINLFNAPFQVNEECKRLNVNKQKCEQNGDYYFKLFTRPETYLGSYYVSKFDKRVLNMVNNQSEYLYDGALKIEEARHISNDIMPKLFKSFPRTGINFIWPKNNIWHFPISLVHEIWHEEGM